MGVKFIAVFLGLALAGAAGVWAGRGLSDHPRLDPGVEANARLTGYAGVALLIPLGAEIVTGVRPGLLAHALLGFLLLPLVALKLAGVGYRFIRYYTRDPRYLAAGPPELVMRVLGPIFVVLTVVLFATGIELWLFGFRFGDQWLTFHKAAFVLWFAAIAMHVAAYWRRAPQLAFADWRDHLGGAVTRRSLVGASLVLGVVIALAMTPFASPFTSLAGSG